MNLWPFIKPPSLAELQMNESLTFVYHLPFRPHQHSSVVSSKMPSAPPMIAPIAWGVMSVPAAPLMTWVGRGSTTGVALSSRRRRIALAASMQAVALRGRKLRGAASTKPDRMVASTATENRIRSMLFVGVNSDVSLTSRLLLPIYKGKRHNELSSWVLSVVLL